MLGIQPRIPPSCTFLGFDPIHLVSNEVFVYFTAMMLKRKGLTMVTIRYGKGERQPEMVILHQKTRTLKNSLVDILMYQVCDNIHIIIGKGIQIVKLICKYQKFSGKNIWQQNCLRTPITYHIFRSLQQCLVSKTLSI